MAIPTVPVQTEPIARLQARYQAAVMPKYTSVGIQNGKELRPGSQRKHVFDLENGVRLIVCHEELFDGRKGIHVSGSFHAPDVAARHAAENAKLMDPVEAALKLLYTSWTDIAQTTRAVEFIGLSSNQVSHFFIEDAD